MRLLKKVLGYISVVMWLHHVVLSFFVLRELFIEFDYRVLVESTVLIIYTFLFGKYLLITKFWKNYNLLEVYNKREYGIASIILMITLLVYMFYEANRANVLFLFVFFSPSLLVCFSYLLLTKFWKNT